MNESYQERLASLTISLNDTVYRIVQIIQQASTVGTNVHPGATGLMLYPNPANEKIYMTLPEQGSPVLIVDIISVTGEVISSRQVRCQDGLAELDVSSLGTGLYILKISSNQHLFIRKVILK